MYLPCEFLCPGLAHLPEDLGIHIPSLLSSTWGWSFHSLCYFRQKQVLHFNKVKLIALLLPSGFVFSVSFGSIEKDEIVWFYKKDEILDRMNRKPLRLLGNGWGSRSLCSCCCRGKAFFRPRHLSISCRGCEGTSLRVTET